jgi:hypothetical protein
VLPHPASHASDNDNYFNEDCPIDEIESLGYTDQEPFLFPTMTGEQWQSSCQIYGRHQSKFAEGS